MAMRFFLTVFLGLVFPAAAHAQDIRMPAVPPAAVESQNLLGKPDMTDDEITAWATEAAVASLTFGHRDYQQRMRVIAGYFTRDGWQKFTQGMVTTQFLDIVVEQKRALIAAPAGKGAVVQQGLVDGAYGWHIILPMTLYHSTENGDEKKQKINLSLLVARSSENKDGRGIVDWSQVAADK